MRYIVLTFCIWFAMVSPALSYHNCGEEPDLMEVVCEVVRWTERQSGWAQGQKQIKVEELKVVCTAEGFNMTFTVPADSELKTKVFVADPTKLEVCIRPHP